MKNKYLTFLIFSVIAVTSCTQKTLYNVMPSFYEKKYSKRVEPILDPSMYPNVAKFQTPNYQGFHIQISGSDSLKDTLIAEFIVIDKEDNKIPFIQDNWQNIWHVNLPENKIRIEPEPKKGSGAPGYHFTIFVKNTENVKKINLKTNKGNLINIYKKGDLLYKNEKLKDADIYMYLPGEMPIKT